MEAVELLVRLKIPDVTALTAANALRRRMGYEAVLADLRRADYHRLELNVSGPQEAIRLAHELAEGTNLFVNPNKHVYEATPATREPLTTPEGWPVVRVLVTDPEDGSAQGVLAALQGRLGYGKRVAGLLRGTLWSLTLRCPDRQQALDIAQDIAITRSRDRGLLSNPHFQECEIW